MTTTYSRTRKRALWIAVTLGLAVAVLVPARARILTGVGRAMMTSEPLAPADVLVLTPESGLAGRIEASDLLRNHVVKGIVVLIAEPNASTRELQRRGFMFAGDPSVGQLEVLGVPLAAVDTIPASEGGTSESSRALADWYRDRPPTRILVMVSPTHARRFRRALARVWRCPSPFPAIKTTEFDDFRAENWWQSRRTLREGLEELEKLLLDYVLHP
jgi:hypothetical protein